MKNLCKVSTQDVAGQQGNNYIYTSNHNTSATSDIFSFEMLCFCVLYHNLWVFCSCFPLWCLSSFKGRNHCHQEKWLNKSALNRWILTLALSFPIDRESPRSYSSTLTDLGRSTPRERRGTPEKEVVSSIALESFSTKCLIKHLPIKVMSKTSKEPRLKP